MTTSKQPKEVRIFKPIKDLDAEIRTITEEFDDERNEIYYVVDVGYYESLGEYGLINSFFYDEYPSEEDIIRDTREDLRKGLEDYKNKILSGREEGYLAILEKIF